MTLQECYQDIDAKAFELSISTPFSAHNVASAFKHEAFVLSVEKHEHLFEVLLSLIESTIYMALATGMTRIPDGIATLLMTRPVVALAGQGEKER